MVALMPPAFAKEENGNFIPKRMFEMLGIVIPVMSKMFVCFLSGNKCANQARE